MWSLQCMDSTEFPACVVSYGGPQSNSMLAIAAVVQYHNTQLEQIYNASTNIEPSVCDDKDKTGNIAGDDDDLHVYSNDVHPNKSFQRRRFVYYTKKLPSFLRNQPSGNLFRALSLGMEIVEVSNEQYNDLFASAENKFIDTVQPMQLQPPVYGDSVWIPQGGACGMAVNGTERLAQEIYDYWYTNGNNQSLSVCIPGGTCSTALFVHRALQTIQASKPVHERMDIEVIVVPCVGDEVYAQRQMINLNSQVLSNNKHDRENRNRDSIPTILGPTPLDRLATNQWREQTTWANTKSTTNDIDVRNDNKNDYYRFGEPNAAILQTFREFRDEYDILIDLLYGAPCWTILFRHWTSFITGSKSTTASSVNAASKEHLDCHSKFNPLAPLNGRRIMYVHSGGVEGINSQLLRYKHKNLIDIDEIQLPGRDAQFPSSASATGRA